MRYYCCYIKLLLFILFNIYLFSNHQSFLITYSFFFITKLLLFLFFSTLTFCHFFISLHLYIYNLFQMFPPFYPSILDYYYPSLGYYYLTATPLLVISNLLRYYLFWINKCIHSAITYIKNNKYDTYYRLDDFR